jgi:hypothetical protein
VTIESEAKSETGSNVTKDEAVARFRELTRRYGVQWRADVPREAWDELNKCNEVLTEADRREALGLPS